jgi:hypothetical protein
MRNEELGINVVALPWRVLLCTALPRAVPTADEFFPFRAQYGAWSGDWECAWIGLLEHKK